MKIYEIDENFKTESFEGKAIKFLDSKNDVFDLYGVFYADEGYRRIPKEVLISKGVDALADNTSGGRIRFKTNSRHICIKCKLPKYSLPNMTDVASTGFDMNVEEKTNYTKIFQMPYGYDSCGYDCLVDLKNSNDKYITINFPLYNTVNELLIGVDDNAYIDKGKKYRYKEPVVFYGSSITQGAASSRPSSCYTNLLSDRMNLDIINLGFSGSCKGEIEMAKYISSLKMKCLVIDYDHNASNSEELENTHKKFFEYIRKNNPDLPIVIVSRPDFFGTDEDIKRREVIRKTYDFAIRNNDKNVYFIDGEKFYEKYDRECCSVDRTHPNDLGMYAIYEIIRKQLEGIICD